ncbi:AraC-type DNA-binding protein [Nannocystis exedens]|uniref:AraC-type DNA-binding protein n=2 Tax=Nannocystis exedens TaxID=54 RepID=A0A1I2FTK4_9BACT|nr:AraC family transcriptional regulator [Nannocystis exedens]PCC73683.1 transcriptional activator FtrA [Nannocystis exedens]SFF08087.1 AraC-type DNA-binding protein [Nannocystis exedens]
MTDILTTLLRHVRIETTQFGRIELGAPWGARIGAHDGVDLHHVLAGALWLEHDGVQRRIDRGDLLLLPHGQPHCLRSAPDAAVVDAARVPSTGLAVRRRLGGAGPVTVVLCASIALAGAGRSLLLRALPAVVHLPAEGREAVPGLARLLDGIRDEVRARRPGAPLFAARLAELLLLACVRAALERRDEVQGDERIARALQALYRSPARPWTVASLARVAGMSRSAFALAFRVAVGEAPLHHLRRWRIELAKEAMRARPTLALAEVAAEVGYHSEAAFNVAFRREVGAPPGAWRSHPST